MGHNISKKPGAYPKPDDQGNSNTCTRFAISKAIVAGYHDGTWTSGQSIDLDQTWVSSALVNLFPDLDGKWPTDYDGQVVVAMDNKSKSFFKIPLKISPTHSANGPDSKYVLVYEVGSHGDLHSIFMEKEDKGEYCCINSHGAQNQFPRIDPKNVQNKCQLYEIRIQSKSPLGGGGRMISGFPILMAPLLLMTFTFFSFTVFNKKT